MLTYKIEGGGGGRLRTLKTGGGEVALFYNRGEGRQVVKYTRSNL